MPVTQSAYRAGGVFNPAASSGQRVTNRSFTIASNADGYGDALSLGGSNTLVYPTGVMTGPRQLYAASFTYRFQVDIAGSNPLFNIAIRSHLDSTTPFNDPSPIEGAVDETAGTAGTDGGIFQIITGFKGDPGNDKMVHVNSFDLARIPPFSELLIVPTAADGTGLSGTAATIAFTGMVGSMAVIEEQIG